MHFVRLETSDQDVRWINLEQVCRVTYGTETPGVPIAAVVFSEANPEECFKIRGTDEQNQAAIDHLVQALDRLAAVR